jgi:hypothetical protein
MEAHMAFNHFSHQAVDSATTGRNCLKNCGALVRILVERPLDAIDLAADSP